MNNIELDLIKISLLDRCTDYGLYYKNIHNSILFIPSHYCYLYKSMGCIIISNRKKDPIIQTKVSHIDIGKKYKIQYHRIPVKRKEENVYE